MCLYERLLAIVDASSLVGKALDQGELVILGPVAEKVTLTQSLSLRQFGVADASKHVTLSNLDPRGVTHFPANKRKNCQKHYLVRCLSLFLVSLILWA